MLEYLVFFFFASVAVIFAALVVIHRNPVVGALSLVASFFSLAVMYVLLEAPFLAALQVIVYAGAIMVLFLFVIMLLNLQHQHEPATRPIPQFLGYVRPIAFGVVLIYHLRKYAVETIVNAGTLALVRYGRQFHPLHGLLFVFFVMAIGAAEAAVGLAIFTSLFHHRETIDVDEANFMHW